MFQQTKSGVILALNKESGRKIWKQNIDAEIGQVGPSIASGTLFGTDRKDPSRFKRWPPTRRIYNCVWTLKTELAGSEM